MDAKGISLKRLMTESAIDERKCIICQIDKRSTLSGTQNERRRAMEDAGLRNDVVLKRLQRANVEHFLYDVDNECYKAYKLSTTLRRIEKNRTISLASSSAEASASCTENSCLKDFKRARTRSLSSKRRPPPTNTLSKRERVCSAWATQHRGSFDKYRICEDKRADTFLQATVFFQDEVYHRTCDRQDIAAVFGADIHCHKECIKLYLLKYETSKNRTR